MKTVRDIPHLENIPVLVRAALNVPVLNGKVVNPFRLKQAVATIQYLQSRHAKVILCGHLGDQGTESLRPVYEALAKEINNLSFTDAVSGAPARDAARALRGGEALMLENLRRDPGEKKNDAMFARELASVADVVVEDSFDVMHRAHASVVGVTTLLPAYAGLLVEREITELRKALKPSRPALAIIGGAKFSTKEPVLKQLLSSYDRVFVGGALANDFLKAAGKPVGTSLVSDADATSIGELLKNPKLLLPKDCVAAPIGSDRSAGRVCSVDEVKESEAVLDNGPETIAMLDEVVRSAQTVLWNGPLGNYERGFVEGTEALATVIARSKAHSIIGGGDTVAAIEKLGLNDHISFISTGGGAMLDFLADGSLPGIKALR